MNIAPMMAIEIKMETQDITIYPNLESISKPFQGLLLDAYGVFWGGNAFGLLPQAKETMERLVGNGKIIGILSNATQLAENEIEKLKTHGLIQGKHFHFLITSGSLARDLLLKDNLPLLTPNKKFYVLGAPHPKFSSHQYLFQNTLFEQTSDLNSADFIYISIPHIDGKDQTNPLAFKELVNTFKDTNIPMLCVNPDRFAHEGNPPKAVVRQGSIALMHEKQGGQVCYIGKPSKQMYIAAMKQFANHGILLPQKVLMVGDTPETDIRGAKSFGMPSALVTTTGIMADRIYHEGFENAMKALTEIERPEFFIEKMTKNEL